MRTVKEIRHHIKVWEDVVPKSSYGEGNRDGHILALEWVLCELKELGE